jgi:hypothetical protein
MRPLPYFDSCADGMMRMGLPPLLVQLRPVAWRSLECRGAHGTVHCAQRISAARNRRHVPGCVRRLFGLDDAVNNNAFAGLVSQARAPRAAAPKGRIFQARSCLAFCLCQRCAQGLAVVTFVQEDS